MLADTREKAFCGRVPKLLGMEQGARGHPFHTLIHRLWIIGPFLIQYPSFQNPINSGILRPKGYGSNPLAQGVYNFFRWLAEGRFLGTRPCARMSPTWHLTHSKAESRRKNNKPAAHGEIRQLSQHIFKQKGAMDIVADIVEPFKGTEEPFSRP